MNVLGGERYKNPSKEVKEYLKGFYGRPPAPIDPEVAHKIIGDDETISCRPADLLEPELEKFQKEGEEMGIISKEEDVLTFALYPAVAPKFLRGETEEEPLAPPKSEAVATTPSDHTHGVSGLC